ncbi:MAG: hypothetical protein H0T84_00390 [Tatlockia sp.]|nr:hypothetical protein [Tatlockia sp.]
MTVQQDEIENLLTKPRLKSPIKSPVCPSISIMGLKEMKEIEGIEFGNSPTKSADIDKLLTRSRLKIKSKIGTLSTSSLLGKEQVKEIELRNSLIKTYQNFTNTFDQYKTPTFNKNEIIENCLMDHLIILNKASLNKIEEQISKLITEMTISWQEKFRAFQTEDHHLLYEQLNETIVKLNALSNQKNEIKESILARQKYLLPAEKTSINELQISLEKDKKCLRETLESFFKEFIGIKFTSNDKSTLFVQAKLKEFVKAIQNNFKKKYMPFNNDKLSNFIVILLWHLGEKPLIPPKIKPKIDEVIRLFLKDTFDASTVLETKDQILINQIIAVRSFTDQIKLFSISEIKCTYELKKLQEEQESTLAQETKNIINYTTNLIGKLNKGISLLTNKNQPNDLLNSSYKAVSNLVKFENTIAKIHQKYVYDKIELEKNPSALEALAQITNLQKLYLANLQKLKEEIENPNQYHEIGSSNSKKLSISYTQEKELIISQIKTAISDAKAALKIYKTDQEVDTLLAVETEEIEEVRKSNSKIIVIENNIIPHIDLLEAHIFNTRKQLKDEKGLILDKIKSDFKDLENPLLHKSNPFNSQLKDDEKLALENLKKANKSYQLLGSCAPTKLQDNVNIHDATIKSVKTAINVWTDNLASAHKIEERLFCNEYITSTNIIKTLKEEYLRISGKKIHKAIDHYKNKKEDVIRSNLLDFLILDNLSEEQLNLLNIIDRRLFKLWSIKNEFEQINKDYINKVLASRQIVNQLKSEYRQILQVKLEDAIKNNPNDERLINIQINPNILFTKPELVNEYQDILVKIDPNLTNLCKKIHQPSVPREIYVKQLLQKVEAHLHNDQMEHFSDNKHSAFFQFIRTYIIKPLQILMRKLSSIFSEENNPHCFFATAGATKTEAVMIEKGNEAAQNLLTACAN